MIPKSLLLSALILVPLFVGCGGGGAGGGDPDPPPSGTYPFAGTYIEVHGSGASGRMDPLNLRPGQSGTLQLVRYTADGSRTVLRPTWSVQGAGGAVTVEPATGSLQVIGPATGVFGFSANLAGTIHQQDGRVVQETTTVSGVVRPVFSSLGVRFIQIELFDDAGNKVGGAVTDGDGRFQASVPAVSLHLGAKQTTIPTHRVGTAPGFYRILRYNALNFLPEDSTCRIPIGTPTSGGDNALPFTVELVPLTQMPPFPNGCW